ncbi:1,2-phenylacetyl-CoA epoxidase subunit PaaC [Halomarina litorea]|uniref:1,2-phenylacetyl-CoA epoxidase subunit PaaC n=1 Tax=Halomarina litorea TaxID=2961595 RepID=UPI0020C50285|nr:1,2-phenylacetyl-CoA epoxidase subunit PaaC [Halomarina sp. BCD28]
MAVLGTPGELSEREREAVQSLLFALADDEFVLADRYTEWQCQGPTLEADIAIANIAQDELGHARLWYDLLQDFGPSESELIWERDPEAFRHSTLVERPFAAGDWADAVVRSYLYDVAEFLQLEALTETTYPRIADRVGKVRGEEHYHREHAQNWLERLCEDEAGRRRVQDAVDELFPHALTLFVPTEHEADIVELAIRPTPIDQLRDEWLSIVGTFLDGLGVSLPMDPDDDPDEFLPGARGRDGSHTDPWFRQFNELTYTYRMLDRTEAPRLMPDPDDV